MYYVVDFSFSSALFLPDEKSTEVDNFFRGIGKDDQVFVPMLWWYETINVFNVSQKRNRLKHKEIAIVIDLFEKMGLTVDSEYGPHWAKKLADLSVLYRITSYDAAYLELAARKKGKLMSLDSDLINAAKKFGIY